VEGPVFVGDLEVLVHREWKAQCIESGRLRCLGLWKLSAWGFGRLSVWGCDCGRLSA
jgi:hypothetical protein